MVGINLKSEVHLKYKLCDAGKLSQTILYFKRLEKLNSFLCVRKGTKIV